MNKLIKLLLLILIFFSFFIFLNFLLGKRINNGESLQIYSDSKGSPMFATGNCNTGLDCFPSGCSDHICANHDVVTTCENINFPEKETYTCGCINNGCVWYK